MNYLAARVMRRKERRQGGLSKILSVTQDLRSLVEVTYISGFSPDIDLLRDLRYRFSQFSRLHSTQNELRIASWREIIRSDKLGF